MPPFDGMYFITHCDRKNQQFFFTLPVFFSVYLNYSRDSCSFPGNCIQCDIRVVQKVVTLRSESLQGFGRPGGCNILNRPRDCMSESDLRHHSPGVSIFSGVIAAELSANGFTLSGDASPDNIVTL